MLLYANTVATLTFRGFFVAPLTTKPTDPFKLTIKEPGTGAVIVTDNNDIVLADLEPNEMQEVRTAQVNSVMVGSPTAVAVTVTTLNPIPATGGVQLRMPKWNPKAPTGLRESFLVDEVTFSTLDFTTELPNAGATD